MFFHLFAFTFLHVFAFLLLGHWLQTFTFTSLLFLFSLWLQKCTVFALGSLAPHVVVVVVVVLFYFCVIRSRTLRFLLLGYWLHNFTCIF